MLGQELASEYREEDSEKKDSGADLARVARVRAQIATVSSHTQRQARAEIEIERDEEEE